jgi:hypothetical protein
VLHPFSIPEIKPQLAGKFQKEIHSVPVVSRQSSVVSEEIQLSDGASRHLLTTDDWRLTTDDYLRLFSR